MTKNETPDTVTLKFNRDTTHLEGENDLHKAGEIYECTPAQAQAWLNRGAAELVNASGETEAEAKHKAKK